MGTGVRRGGFWLALASVLALFFAWQGAAVLSATTIVAPFAGNWSTFNGTGTLTLDAQTTSKGEASTAYYSNGTAKCVSGATYYAGDYRVASGDSGYFAGCTNASGTHLMAWYRSATSSNAGTVSITIGPGDTSFSGTYDQTSDGTGGAYDGIFTSDSQGSGRTKSSTSPTTTTGGSGLGCLYWDVAGSWSITQSNGYSPTWNLTQSGTHITGTEVLSSQDEARGNYDGTTSSLVGTIVGDTIEIVVTSPPKNNGPAVQGEFLGNLTEGASLGQGVVSGPAGPPGSPQQGGVTWSGSGPAVCEGGWKLGFTFEGANGLFDGHGEATSCAWQGAVPDIRCTPATAYTLGDIVDLGCSPSVRCSPQIKMQIIAWKFSDVALAAPRAPFSDWRQPPYERTLTLTVRVSASSNGRQCAVGDEGTATVIDRDLLNSSTNVHASAFKLGGWTRPCANQTFDLDAARAPTSARSPTGPPLKPGQFTVVAGIACSTRQKVNSWNPVTCVGLKGP